MIFHRPRVFALIGCAAAMLGVPHAHAASSLDLLEAGFEGGGRPVQVDVDAPAGWTLTSELGGGSDGVLWVDAERPTLLWAQPAGPSTLILAAVSDGASAVTVDAEQTALAITIGLPPFAGLDAGEFDALAEQVRGLQAFDALVGRIQSAGGFDTNDTVMMDNAASVIVGIVGSGAAKQVVSNPQPDYVVSDGATLTGRITVEPRDAGAVHAAEAIVEPVASTPGAGWQSVVATNALVTVQGTVQTGRIPASTTRISDDLIAFVLDAIRVPRLPDAARRANLSLTPNAAVRVFSGVNRSDFAPGAPAHWNAAADRALAANISYALVSAIRNLVNSAARQGASPASCRDHVSDALMDALAVELAIGALAGDPGDLMSVMFSVGAKIYDGATACAVSATAHAWLRPAMEGISAALKRHPAGVALIVANDLSPAPRIALSMFSTPGVETHAVAGAGQGSRYVFRTMAQFDHPNQCDLRFEFDVPAGQVWNGNVVVCSSSLQRCRYDPEVLSHSQMKIHLPGDFAPNDGNACVEVYENLSSTELSTIGVPSPRNFPQHFVPLTPPPRARLAAGVCATMFQPSIAQGHPDIRFNESWTTTTDQWDIRFVAPANDPWSLWWLDGSEIFSLLTPSTTSWRRDHFVLSPCAGSSDRPNLGNQYQFDVARLWFSGVVSSQSFNGMCNTVTTSPLSFDARSGRTSDESPFTYSGYAVSPNSPTFSRSITRPFDECILGSGEFGVERLP